MGGYGVCQAYRRMIREESTENNAENLVLYIWGMTTFEVCSDAGICYFENGGLSSPQCLGSDSLAVLRYRNAMGRDYLDPV